MASVLGAFLLLMVTGGCIAYFGDRLGYMMGKRRVTLFGLRPRHTAQALTIFSGVIIGGLALTLLLIVNYTFRFALLHGTELLITNHNLEVGNRRLSGQLKENLAVAQSAETAAAAAQQRAASATTVLEQSEQNLDHAEKTTLAVELELKSKQTDLGKLTAQLASQQQKLIAVQAQVIVANKNLQTAQQINEQDVRFRKISNIVFRKNEELGRVVISAAASPTDIRDELISFLNRLSHLAGRMGAIDGPNGRTVVLASIRVVDRRAAQAQSKNTQTLFQENQIIEGLTTSINSYGRGSVVLIANAIGNSYQGEQVIIVLRPFANLLAIPAGTVLGVTQIDDSSASVDQIVGQLQDFLLTQVRPMAIKYGVIPVNDPHTGSVELGDVSLDQIYDVVHKIRDVNGPVTITAAAAQNTYSADKLLLTFGVKPLNVTP